MGPARRAHETGRPGEHRRVLRRSDPVPGRGGLRGPPEAEAPADVDRPGHAGGRPGRVRIVPAAGSREVDRAVRNLITPQESLDRPDPDLPERDRVAVAREPEVAARPVLAGVGLVAHELLHLTDIPVRDPGAVQLDRDLRALDGDLHENPIADRAIAPAVAGDHPVDGTIDLARIDLRVFGSVVV